MTVKYEEALTGAMTPLREQIIALELKVEQKESLVADSIKDAEAKVHFASKQLEEAVAMQGTDLLSITSPQTSHKYGRYAAINSSIASHLSVDDDSDSGDDNDDDEEEEEDEDEDDDDDDDDDDNDDDDNDDDDDGNDDDDDDEEEEDEDEASGGYHERIAHAELTIDAQGCCRAQNWYIGCLASGGASDSSPRRR